MMINEYFDIYVIRKKIIINEIIEFKNIFLKNFLFLEDSYCYYKSDKEIQPSFETNELKEFIVFLSKNKSSLINLYFSSNKVNRGMIFFNLDGSVLLGKRYAINEVKYGYKCFVEKYGKDNVFCIWSENIPNRLIDEISKDILLTPTLLERLDKG